jgi:glycosyltransferase involved in cell wall biosynthesis
MKILQIIDGMAVGGAEKLVVTFAQEAGRRSLSATVLSLHQNTNPHFEQQINEVGGRIIAFPNKRLLDPQRINKVTRFIEKGGYDVVQCHLTYANVVGPIACRLAGIPAIGTIHTANLETDARMKIRQWFESLTLRHFAHSVIAVGQTVADVHQKRLQGQTINVVPNGVALPQTISPENRIVLREKLVKNASRPLIISVGRLEPVKAFHDLIEAFALVHKHAPDAALLIAGEGELRPQLEKQIKTLGLGQTVFLAGILNNIPEVLAAGDIFTLSSHWEGLPLAVLEAMMAGLPPILTRVGDIPTTVIPGAGVLTSPQQPAEMAAAICELIDDHEKRQTIGQTARQHAIENYNQSVWFERLMRIYGRACQQDMSAYL